MPRGELSRQGNLRILLELLETPVLALAVSCLLYFCYFSLATWIWSQNIDFNPQELTPWIRGFAAEHDGVEIYALYLLMFGNAAGACAVSGLLRRCAGESTRLGVFALCGLLSLGYCATVGFTAPMNSVGRTPLQAAIGQAAAVAAAVFAIIALLLYLQRRFPRAAVAAVLLLLAPVCFLATDKISWLDYSYTFAPALRLLKGVPLSEIYFQYDLLLSLLAAGWMKLGLDLHGFPLLGQAGYYLAILAICFLARELFRNKVLAVFLLVALVLARLYATPFDPVAFFQVTPLRLDLWLPLLILAYRLGPYHWACGLMCAVLILVHKTFGIIVSLAYLQMLATLWAIDLYDGAGRSGVPDPLTCHLKRALLSAVMMAAALIASHFLFSNQSYPDYAGYYRKIGIGFIQIGRNSFYWYVPAVVSTVVLLLLRLRSKLSPRYLASGFLLTYCAIGSSIYFFGRSHENNILNISLVLMPLFFLLLDLLQFSLDEAGACGTLSLLKRYGVIAAAAALILVMVVCYSDTISRKTSTQFQRLKNFQFGFEPRLPESFPQYLARIRSATDNSRKVYFIDADDFTFCYYGGYDPVGYCTPFLTWIFARELSTFLQGLLDRGYYLVCGPPQRYQLQELNYDYQTAVDDITVVALRRTARLGAPHGPPPSATSTAQGIDH